MASTSDAASQAQSPPSRAPEALASYTVRPRHNRSTSETTVSPTASVERSENTSSDEGMKRRPRPQRRPYSEHSQIHRKIQVQTISEHADHHGNQRDEHLQSENHTTRCRSSPPNNQASTSTSSQSLAFKPLDLHTQGRSSGSEDSALLPGISGRPPLGRTWSRTKSGSVWYERLRASPAKSKDSLPVSSSEVAPQLLIPLPPPSKSVGEQPGPPYRHLVRIERSFTKLHAAKEPEEAPLPTSRKSSINPRRLFSAPLQLVRRFSLSRRRSKDGSRRSLSPSSAQRALRLADHKSLLKRNRTSEALRRVNSILEETDIVAEATSPVSVVSSKHARSISEKSTSWKGAVLPSSKTKKSPHEYHTEGRIDSEDFGQRAPDQTSYTSSQLVLRRGAQPNNTPDELATYTIKRSPSAETQEFLKVDISVRGGTSYLPSEARRIHTPPLPQDGVDGKKRGFFFDYNAPRQSESRHEEMLDPASIPVRNASRISSGSKKAFLNAGRVVTRPRTNDWYDAKLAQLEASEDDGTFGSLSQRNRSTAQASLSEIRKRKEEETFDMTIPEHLPSSPLCPRHPRYWRIVKGKGSQFRGCWMHGTGLWDGQVNIK